MTARTRSGARVRDRDLGLPMPSISNRIFRQEIKGPGWIGSDRYTIEAKADRPATTEMMRRSHDADAAGRPVPP